jgi:hypothetical protein
MRGDGSRDRASGEAEWHVAVRRGVGSGDLHLSRKNADGPLPHFHPAAVPDVPRGSLVRPATADVRDTVLRDGELATVFRRCAAYNYMHDEPKM